MTQGSHPRVRGVFDHLDHKTHGHSGELGSWEGILDIFLGFANATQITFGDNRTECQFAVESLVVSADRGYTVISARWFNWFDFWFAIDKWLMISYELYAIQYSCYQSYFEIKDLLIAYWKFTSDGSVTLFNLFYSGGPIIKSITNLILFFWAKEYTRVQDAFGFGMEIGQIFWMTFYPIEDYLEMALEKGAVFG